MDQIKTGNFLKTLRKEKGLTQEQLAEKFNTTNRTVSRWETGINMPDLGVLVEMADFYDVDIKEIIDGERKSENMEREMKETLTSVAEFVDNEKEKSAMGIQKIGIVGSILLLIAFLLMLKFTTGIGGAVAAILTFIAFVIMLFTTFKANYTVIKVNKKNSFAKIVKIVLLVMSAIAIVSVFNVVIATVMFMAVNKVSLDSSQVVASDVVDYDKAALVTEYGHDIDSGLFLFPDEVNGIDASYSSNLAYGLLDTDGYIILSVFYTDEQYAAELDRLSSVSCTINGYTESVMYDEDSYEYPAYIACDGFDYVYEYALLDSESLNITYVLLSNPDINSEDLVGVLKIDTGDYSQPTWGRFSIYAHSFDDGNSYMEWSDYN